MCRSRLLASRIQNMLDLWAHVSSEAIFVDNQFLHDINSSAEPAGSQGQGKGKGGAAQQAQAQNLQWCSLWALMHVITIMDLYMSLMVEMDLVGVEEWDYFYWYWDYLASTGVFAGEKLRTQRFQLDQEMHEFAKIDAERLKLAEESANSKKSGGKNKKKKGPETAAESAAASAAALPVPVLLPAPVEELLLKGRGMLCRGVYRMCCLAGAAPRGLGTLCFIHALSCLCLRGLVFSHLPRQRTTHYSCSHFSHFLNAAGSSSAEGGGLIDKDEGRYSSWEIKFQHRFQAFAELSNPPPVSYADFLASTGRGAGGADTGSAAAAMVGRDLAYVGNLTQGAMMCFQHAKKTFDDARKESVNGAVAAAPSAGGADKFVQNTIVSLTKVGDSPVCICSSFGYGYGKGGV